MKTFLFLFLLSGCVLISAFASLVGVPVGIMSSAIGLKNSAITAGIRRYKSIIQKKGKGIIIDNKLNTMEALIDSHVNHEEFVLVDNVLREYDKTKDEIKNCETSVE